MNLAFINSDLPGIAHIEDHLVQVHTTNMDCSIYQEDFRYFLAKRLESRSKVDCFRSQRHKNEILLCGVNKAC
jgi:hypothetical protein